MPITFKQITKLMSALLTTASLVVFNDAPWKGKSYDQWDDSDLRRIFTDSPWSRVTSITRTWLPISQKETTPNAPISGRDRSLPGDVAHSSEASVGGEVNFYVYWASSRVMRAASARKSVLHGGKQVIDVEKYASEPQDEYQVVLQSEDMAPFFRHDEKFFQESAYLEMKKTKQKILPTHVRYEREEKGLLVTAAVFLFPKKTQSGDPSIAPDEKRVEFICKMEGTTLRAEFEPQKMIDAHGPDL